MLQDKTPKNNSTSYGNQYVRGNTNERSLLLHNTKFPFIQIKRREDKSSLTNSSLLAFRRDIPGNKLSVWVNEKHIGCLQPTRPSTIHKWDFCLRNMKSAWFYTVEKVSVWVNFSLFFPFSFCNNLYYYLLPLRDAWKLKLNNKSMEKNSNINSTAIVFPAKQSFFWKRSSSRV